MTNQTIASRIVDLVKGIFGPKESATATAPEEDKDAAAATTESTEDAQTDETKTEETAAEDIPAEAEPAAAAEEDADTSDEEPAEPTSPRAENKDEVADELQTAEAKTVSASREAMENASAAAEAAAGAPVESDLPISNYDSVTIASMRARLRKLSLDDVRTLRAYEAANADRADFLKMYDNRIAKVEKEG